VRFFSKTAAVRPAEFQSLKMYAWTGSPAQVELMKALGYQPVVLETADILPGLQTGLIDAVPLIPTWALVAQIDTLAPHMLEMRWVPVVGAAGRDAQPDGQSPGRAVRPPAGGVGAATTARCP
jgi:TRAP-type C4-dicarboxylate transport system substrate-binding protein